MTNAHCSECGDPIFRYDGQEFCPTCEKPVNRQPDGQEPEDGDEGEDGEQIEVTSPSDDARVAFGEESDGADASPDPEALSDSASAEQESRRERAQPDRRQQSEEDARPQQPREATLPAQHERELPNVDRSTPPTDANAAETGASVTAARESLVATLTRFSRLAEQTEDPRQAQEYLAATREAAETLAELRR